VEAKRLLGPETVGGLSKGEGVICQRPDDRSAEEKHAGERKYRAGGRHNVLPEVRKNEPKKKIKDR